MASLSVDDMHSLSPCLVALPTHRRWLTGAPCLGSLTSGGMWPRCICPTMTCCCGEGMLPTLKVSGPLEPERITAGRATEPCSAFPVRLNCCCKMVDLRGTGSLVTEQRKAVIRPQISPVFTALCYGGLFKRGIHKTVNEKSMKMLK